jgi:hypothetical protein
MPLSWNEIKSRAMAFSREWGDAADEASQAKPFWIAFFEIFGITDKRVATFELNVRKLGTAHGFVDLFWPGMLLVEHKSRGKDLDLAFQQALDYFPGLPERDLPQIIMVCDFARFRVHRLYTGETVEFALKDLHKHIRQFGFIAGYKAQAIKAQDPVNIKAAERMGRLHDALKASGYTGHPLEVLLVRLLFCLFADDTGIFQPAQSFRAFVEERTDADGSTWAAAGATVPDAEHARAQTQSGAGRAAGRLPLHQRASSLKSRCPWPTSPPPCARPCWTPARSTGRPSARPSSAACSRASWTRRRAATWARTTPARRTSSSSSAAVSG